MPVYFFIHPRVGILVVSRSWAWTSLPTNICFYRSWGNTQGCLPKRNSCWLTWQVNGGHFQKPPNGLLRFVPLYIPTCILEVQPPPPHQHSPLSSHPFSVRSCQYLCVGVLHHSFSLNFPHAIFSYASLPSYCFFDKTTFHLSCPLKKKSFLGIEFGEFFICSIYVLHMLCYCTR